MPSLCALALQPTATIYTPRCALRPTRSLFAAFFAPGPLQIPMGCDGAAPLRQAA